MCTKEKKCQNPDMLKGKPGECTPEQIRKCHGEGAVHPCITLSSDEKPEQ